MSSEQTVAFLHDIRRQRRRGRGFLVGRGVFVIILPALLYGQTGRGRQGAKIVRGHYLWYNKAS